MSSSQRTTRHKTPSQIEVEPVYTPENLGKTDYARDLGLPGEQPYLRGIYATGYRGRLWTMRMFAGFGRPEETNQRFKFLLEQGQTGLSVAFDMPSLYGYDTDDPRAAGEFGKCGVAVSSLADMELLFDGIPLDQVTTSMTINAPAAIIWAMYIAVAQKQGIAMADLGGTIQNDILKEYIAQNEYIFPPTRRCGWSWTLYSSPPNTCPSGIQSALAATTFGKPDPRQFRSWLLPWLTGSSTSAILWTAACGWMTSFPG